MYVRQLFFEPLTEPSLHRNRFPSQLAMPPLLPEHGVLATNTVSEDSASTAETAKQSMKGLALQSRGEGLLTLVNYSGSPTKTARPVSPSHPEGGD